MPSPGRRSSVGVEDHLILRDLPLNGCHFLSCWQIGVGGWWQCAELHQGGHQQEPSLRRREVRATDEGGVVERNKTLSVAAADTNHGKSAIYRSEQQPSSCIGGAPSVRGETFNHETGERHGLEHVT